LWPVRSATQVSVRPLASAMVTKVARWSWMRIRIRFGVRSNKIGRMPPAVADPVVETLDAPPAPKYKDLWERIRAGFALKEIDSPLVARHEAWYLNRPEYVQRMVERSHRYLYFIIEELEKRNMPT